MTQKDALSLWGAGLIFFRSRYARARAGGADSRNLEPNTLSGSTGLVPRRGIVNGIYAIVPD